MAMSQTAFLFPGQGAQYVGMGKALCESVPGARELFSAATGILGYDLLQVCVEGPADKLNSTVVSQPAIFVASLAALESLRVTQPDVPATVTATAGLSLGEYTALVFAGALDFADGLRIVQKRGAAMQAAADASPGGMVSVLGLEQPAVEDLCHKASAEAKAPVQIANLLCPGNIAVSGAKTACDAIEKLGAAAGARTVRLAVAGAFHTALMHPADQRLAEALAAVTIRPPRVPVWSNVDAKPHTDPEELRALLVRQVVQPVLWEQTVRGLFAAGCDRYYEIGPGRVLAGLLKRVQRKVECQNISA
jgi:[acyl-carrier-protein] S-malonyltransferase